MHTNVTFLVWIWQHSFLEFFKLPSRHLGKATTSFRDFLTSLFLRDRFDYHTKIVSMLNLFIYYNSWTLFLIFLFSVNVWRGRSILSISTWWMRETSIILFCAMPFHSLLSPLLDSARKNIKFIISIIQQNII